MRIKAALLVSVLAAMFISQSACASDHYESDRYSVSMALTGRGLTSTVTLSLENRGAEPLTAVIRDIALNGECTGHQASWEAVSGQSVHTVSFHRESLSPVTVCDAGIAILDNTGSILCEQVLTVYPYGESAARRPALTDYPDAVVALDTEAASLLIMPASAGGGNRRILWLYNKSDSLLRLQAERVLADGALTDLSLVIQALPLTGQYAELLLPAPLPKTLSFTLAGYLATEGDRPVFRETYDFSLSDPVSVATMVPLNTPAPQIGTVTIRKSGAVNVRDGDNTSARKIGSAKAGKTYPCYGVSPAGWYLIRLEDGTEGYVTNTLSTFQRQ